MKNRLMSLLVFGFCMFLFGCQSLIEYPSLSDITKNEEFTKAYIASVNGDAQVIAVDYRALKEKDFFKNIMKSGAKATDVLPESIPLYSLVLESDGNDLQIDDLGDLYAKYKDEWYLLRTSDSDENALYNYLFGKEAAPDDSLQIIRNAQGKIVFNVIALNNDDCDIKYKDLRENKTIIANNKDFIFNYLFELLNGRDSVYDYTNCLMDYSIELSYELHGTMKETWNTYQFKFHSECCTMTIIKNNDLIGTVSLSNEEINTLIQYIGFVRENSFIDLFGYKIEEANEIIIDEGPGSIAPPWMHYVYEVTNEECVNSFLEYLNNAKFVKTNAMPGVGTKDITLKTDDGEIKLSFSNRNELWCNGKLYRSTTDFPELNQKLIYQYYQTLGEIKINTFGIEKQLSTNYFENIKFLPYSPESNLYFATKFGIITLDGSSIMLTSHDTFMDLHGGTYTIVGDKDFSDLLENVNTETVSVLIKLSDSYSYTIIVSKDTLYTEEELKAAIPEYEPYRLLMEDGSEFESLIITDDITLLFQR